MKLTQALDGYWLDKKLDFSPATIRNYGHTFNQFLDYIGDIELQEISSDDIRRYLNYLHTDRGLAKRSVHSHWAILSSFWSWAEKELQIAHIIRGRVARPDYRKRIIQPFMKSDLARLVRATRQTQPWTSRNGKRVRSKRPTALRDRAIVLTLADTGLRASELTALKVEDYDSERGRFHVRHGKGDKERISLAGSRTRKALWRYLAERKSSNPREPLFATRDNRFMRRDNLYHLLARLGESAGVTNVHPHRFRHTFAIEFLRNSGSILVLKELLGHENLEMVMVYVQIAERDLDDSSRHSPADNWQL